MLDAPASRSTRACASSRDARLRRADGDQELARRFRAAGFVVVGRTNTPELGHPPDHRALRLRAAAQPVGHGALDGRLERRIRRRGGVGHGGGRPRQRRRRVDPHPGQRVRAGRPQAVSRPCARSARTGATSWAAWCASSPSPGPCATPPRVLDAVAGPLPGDPLRRPPRLCVPIVEELRRRSRSAAHRAPDGWPSAAR